MQSTGHISKQKQSLDGEDRDFPRNRAGFNRPQRDGTGRNRHKPACCSRMRPACM